MKIIYTIPEAEKELSELKNCEVKIELLPDSIKETSNHIIDCDKDPFIPDGWEVEEHKKGGIFNWDKNKVKLYLDKKQETDYIEGNKLRKLLEKKKTLNANVLDYLLAHPGLIPKEWEGTVIFFWGTIYRISHGGSYVRFLGWDGKQWCWDYGWLGVDFGSTDPAALAS